MDGAVAQTGSVERRLPPQAGSVPEARRMVRALLEEVGRPDLVENATLLVSEVVTNALLHAGTTVEVSLVYDHPALHVEVGDGSSHLPVRRDYGAVSGTGRGLRLLERLVDDWGVTAIAEGKVVWFRMSVAEDETAASVTSHVDVAAPAQRASGLEVELRNMPLLLHAAWQEHAEALLREYLLANLDELSGDDSIQVHARAVGAIAVLAEHVPRAEVAIEPEQLMRDATEPRVSAAAVHVPVPEATVPDFAVLERTLEEALGLARDGVLMTPPTQPELQTFRRWVCGEIRSQLRGAAPTAWSMDREPPTLPGIDLDWDSGDVTHADTGRIAADEASRIFAVSPGALGILGYDDAADLVGRRIVSIVPERFRQAHVAGFTMFLLTGRRPLIDTTVTVPVLRRDGSEVPVDLTLSVQQAKDGHFVFVADLRPV